MNQKTRNARLYETLCRVLDAIRNEAAANSRQYHVAAENEEAMIQARSRALIHLFLKARFGLINFVDREALITDGRGDGGIDAYYIDVKNKIIYLLQSKFRANAEGFVNTQMSPTELLRMEVSRILRGYKNADDGTRYNEKIVKGLQKAIKKLPDAGSYKTSVVLLGNAKKLTESHLHRLIQGYHIDQYSHERAYRELLFPVVNGTYFTDPNLRIEINLANMNDGKTHLDYNVHVGTQEPNVKLVFVPTREIGRIMHTYKNSILHFNPRSFLELDKNKVNGEISNSIRKTESNEFALFNNGITMISDNTLLSTDTAKRQRAQLVLLNPQLVNGAQTAYTLSRIYEESLSRTAKDPFKGKEVLLKIITFEEKTRKKDQAERTALIGAISKASNSQSKVEESDRRSNDPIQIRLQETLFDRHGLYYERKRGEFSDGLHYGYVTQDLLVNRERLVRVCLACDFKANQARSSVAKFFGEHALAELIKLSDVDKYAYGYGILELLGKRLRHRPRPRHDRYRSGRFGQALRYGQYAVVAVCANLGWHSERAESDVLDAVLAQWKEFERWVARRRKNRIYKLGAAFDFVTYYKGSTINTDLQKYGFKIQLA